MRQLFKHLLDFDPAWKFTYDSLYEVNQLSSELLNVIDFKSGYFFTLLPQDANIGRLYEFKTGLILPQFPEESYTNGRKGTFTRIPNLYEEIADAILNEIKSKNLCCIFDDVTRYPDDKNIFELFRDHGFSYGKEVYYFLDKNTASQKLIMDCLRKSKSFWHSLCILTKNLSLSQNNKDLSLELIKKICLNTHKLLVEAYDGEGYIFWEKSD